MNRRTITSVAGESSDAFGLYLAGTVSGDVMNSGTITSIVGEGSSVHGILNQGTVSGDVANSGTITATSGANGSSTGISNQGTISGSVTNSGTVTSTAGDGGDAYGVNNSNTTTGNVINSGSIIATANGVGSAAYGIFNQGTLGGIVNTGTITATDPGGTAWAIWNGGSGISINQNTGFINGNVGLSGADTFNINGGTVTGSVIGNQTFGNPTDTVNFNGGTLAVPAGGSVSAIENYTQGANATLSLGVTSAGSSATLSAANITAGGTLKAAPSGGGWTLNTPVTYIDAIVAGSSFSGSFANVNAPALFTANLTPDGSTAYNLSVTEVSAGSDPAINSFIAGLLNSGGSSPAAQNLANGLEGLSAPQLQAAITQLKGPAVAQSIQALRGVSSDFSGMVQQRLLAGGAYDTSDLLSLSMVGQNIQIAGLTDRPLLALAPAAEGGIWMRGFGSFASGAPQGTTAGFNQDRGGVIFGADKKFNDNWTLGAAVQYAHTTLSYTDGSASSNADSYNGLLYGGWHQNRLYVNGTTGFGWNVYNSSRSLLVGGFTANPSGSFSGQSYTASAETGYAFHASDDRIGEWTVTPYAGLDYAHSYTSGFTESGDGVSNLMIQASSSDSLISSLGVRAGTSIETKNNGTFLPEVHLAWEHENLSVNQNINAAFISAPGNISFPLPARNMAAIAPWWVPLSRSNCRNIPASF